MAFDPIQCLSQKVDQAREEIAEKAERIEDLEAENEQLHKRLRIIEDHLSPSTPADQGIPAGD